MLFRSPPAPMPALSRATAQAEGLDICESRLVLWRNALELSLQRPWTGWGFGELDYAMATQPLSGTRFCGIVAHAHNLPLQLIVEWGWPLALGWMAWAGAWLWRKRPRAFAAPRVFFGWRCCCPWGCTACWSFRFGMAHSRWRWAWLWDLRQTLAHPRPIESQPPGDSHWPFLSPRVLLGAR